MRRVKSMAVCALLCCVGTRVAADEVLPVALPTVPVQELSARLKESLLKSLPDALVFETSNNWGHQAHVPSLQGIKPIQVMRNHGEWDKARVSSWQMPRYLWVRVADLAAPADDRVVFTVHLAVPATVQLDKRIWQNGIEVYSGRVRARFALTADLTIEATAPPVGDNSTDGHREVRLQIARATFGCDHFVTENVNGLGGDLARLIGAQRKFKAWQPAVLREFQEAVLTAMQLASATNELRTSLSRLVMQSLATRTAMLQAKGAAQRWLAAASTLPAGTVAPPVPIFLCGGVPISIPLVIEPWQTWTREPAGHGEPHAESLERWELSVHTIHYEPPTHGGTEAAAHHEAEHRR